MTSTSTSIRALIVRARAGDAAAIGELLEVHRPLMRFLALRYLDGPLGGRLDASDLVQQTCISVLGRIAHFNGDNPAAFLAWLKQIHEHNLQNAIREHLLAQKRAAGREVSLADRADIENSLAQIRESSPSQRIMQGERTVRLAATLQKLPDDQREAVRLRYLEGRPVAEIAERMARSLEATAGLIKRGLIRLRNELPRDEFGVEA